MPYMYHDEARMQQPPVFHLLPHAYYLFYRQLHRSKEKSLRDECFFRQRSAMRGGPYGERVWTARKLRVRHISLIRVSTCKLVVSTRFFFSIAVTFLGPAHNRFAIFPYTCIGVSRTTVVEEVLEMLNSGKLHRDLNLVGVQQHHWTHKFNNGGAVFNIRARNGEHSSICPGLIKLRDMPTQYFVPHTIEDMNTAYDTLSELKTLSVKLSLFEPSSDPLLFVQRRTNITYLFDSLEEREVMFPSLSNSNTFVSHSRSSSCTPPPLSSSASISSV